MDKSNKLNQLNKRAAARGLTPKIRPPKTRSKGTVMAEKTRVATNSLTVDARRNLHAAAIKTIGAANKSAKTKKFCAATLIGLAAIQITVIFFSLCLALTDQHDEMVIFYMVCAAINILTAPINFVNGINLWLNANLY
jgi:hypothetical protein